MAAFILQQIFAIKAAVLRRPGGRAAERCSVTGRQASQFDLQQTFATSERLISLGFCVFAKLTLCEPGGCLTRQNACVQFLRYTRVRGISNMKFRLFAMLTLLPVFGASVAHASSVTYSFVGIGGATLTVPDEPVAFELTVPAFIIPAIGTHIDFTCAQMNSSTNCGLAPNPYGAFFSSGSTLQFDASNNVGYVFNFPTGAFGAVGTYSAIPDPFPGAEQNTGTLTVTSTPEPTTLFLALSGIGLFSLRRSRSKAA